MNASLWIEGSKFQDGLRSPQGQNYTVLLLHELSKISPPTTLTLDSLFQANCLCLCTCAESSHRPSVHTRRLCQSLVRSKWLIPASLFTWTHIAPSSELICIHVRHQAQSSLLYPSSMELSITISFVLSEALQLSRCSFNCYYELLFQSKHWMVAGRTRGRVSVVHSDCSQPCSLRFTLLPMERAAELPLPQLKVVQAEYATSRAAITFQSISHSDCNCVSIS